MHSSLLERLCASFALVFRGTVLALLFVPGLDAATCDARQVLDLVQQRLALMPAVAHYKVAHSLAVEDVAREALVLASAQRNALRHGLIPVSIEPFMMAQMAAARGIQRRVIAQQAADAGREAVPVPDLVRDIRPRLLALAELQFSSLHCLLKGGGGFGLDDAGYLASLLIDLPITGQEQAALLAGLRKVELIADGDASDLGQH